MSLLSEAKKVKRKPGGRKATYTREQEQVAVAYFKGEVTLFQASRVLQVAPSGSGVCRIASIVTQGVRNGTIKVTLV